MSGTVSKWVIASADLGGMRSRPQADIVGMTALGTGGVVSDTQRRDVSEVLDLLALTETPFINAVGWGPESGGTIIEWISEDIGPGYVRSASAVASGVGGSLVCSSIDGVVASYLVRQLHAGTILYAWCSGDVQHSLGVVTSEPVAAGSVLISWLILGTNVSTQTSVDTRMDYFILGNAQNEGSTPGRAKPRARVVCTNEFTILRRDVAVTGSMQKTDMFAIGAEDQHQIMLRMKEIQRERERIALYSRYSAKTSLAAGLSMGVMGFLLTQSGSHIDKTTKTLTETALNTVVSKIWQNGGRNLTAFGHINQTAKFTRWDKNRIRMRVNDGVGGGRITSYLTESGIEIDLIPMGNCPDNLFFFVDPSRIKLRAKSGRKALLEKLGKMGDSDDWQLLSEFSLEMRGYNIGQHGGFFSLI